MANKKKNEVKTKTKDEDFDDLFEDFEDKVPKNIEPVLRKLPLEDAKLILNEYSVSITESHSGPLPHPRILKGYEDVLQGGAERIFKMAEKQLEHRFGIENKVVDSQNKQSERGQLFGLALALILITLGTVFAYTGHVQLSVAIFTVTVVGLVTIFVVGKKIKPKE